jgi:hypothetical protein
MGQDMAQRYRLVESIGDLESVQVFVDVGVEVELAFLDLLHDGNPGEQLRDGTWPEQGGVRIDRYLLLDILESLPLRKQHLALVHDRDSAGGTLVGCHQRLDDSIDVGFDYQRVVEAGRSDCRLRNACQQQCRGKQAANILVHVFGPVGVVSGDDICRWLPPVMLIRHPNVQIRQIFL